MQSCVRPLCLQSLPGLSLATRSVVSAVRASRTARSLRLCLVHPPVFKALLSFVCSILTPPPPRVRPPTLPPSRVRPPTLPPPTHQGAANQNDDCDGCLLGALRDQQITPAGKPLGSDSRILTRRARSALLLLMLVRSSRLSGGMWKRSFYCYLLYLLIQPL